ncbi:cohesin domain-containing protein [Paraglaciecola sp.]|uniref:cohesin domain-containing protein n=1 Tax=Paraglaciecola sp. TaxID=1920173 RepID=UPI003EF98C17
MKIFKMMMVAALLIGFKAQANLITIDMDDTDVAVGETVNVSLFASFTDAVDTIDFNFNFDNSLFSFVTDSESSDLFFDGIFGATPNADGLGLGFISLFGPISGEFLFASFQLERTQAGDSEFSLETRTLANVFDNGNTAPNFDLQVSVVSAPATLGLFALAGLAMMRLRRNG